jgi:O-antigen/teichoic acid export membrane protein
VGKEAFGALGILQSTAGSLGIFASLGLGMAATKYIAQLRTVDAARAGRIAALTLVVALLSGGTAGAALFLFAPWLATHTMNAPNLLSHLRIASGLVVASVLNGAQIGVLTGLEAFGAIAGVNALRGILSVLIGVVAVWRWGLSGAVVALLICSGAGCCLSQVTLNRVCRQVGLKLPIRGLWREWPILWRFCLPAWLSSAIVGPVIWGASAILVNTSGGYGQMGIFNAANQWRNATLFLPAVLSQPLLPIFADLHRRQPAECRQLMWVSVAAVGLLSAIVAVPICIASPWIMALYGNRFRQSWPVLCILTASTIPAACCGVIGQVIVGCGKLWTGFAMNLLWAVVLISFTLGSKQFGAAGVSASLLISYSVHSVIVTIYTLSIIAYPLSDQ